MDKHKKFHIGIKTLITNTEGKILLLQVNVEKLKYKDLGAYWDIPGGRIEQGGGVETTLKREIQEETGVDEIEDYFFFHASIANIEIPTEDGMVGLALFIYKVKVKEEVRIIISDEHIKYEWFTPKDAAELLKIKYPNDFTNRLLE